MFSTNKETAGQITSVAVLVGQLSRHDPRSPCSDTSIPLFGIFDPINYVAVTQCYRRTVAIVNTSATLVFVALGE